MSKTKKKKKKNGVAVPMMSKSLALQYQEKKGNENTLDMFIFSHKPFKGIVSNPSYKVLTCSHEDFPEMTNLPLYRDYEGDSISDMNLMYNEYTGFYWIWKNWKLKKYVGMNHYRRYYSWGDRIPDMDVMFENFDIVLNRPIYFNENVGFLNFNKDKEVNNVTWYDFWHNVDDLYVLKDVIYEEFPDYIDGFEKMMKADYLYNSSMFIMKKDDFIDYCNFIFPVLEAFRKRMGFTCTDDAIKHVETNENKYLKPHLPYYDVHMQARIVGYIAERAMNAYVMNGENSFEKRAAVVEWAQINM